MMTWIPVPLRSVFAGALSLMLPSMALADLEPLSMQIESDGAELVVRWTSRAVTRAAPFVHPDFALERSANLLEWEDYGERFAGGLLSQNLITNVTLIPDPGDAALFLRLAYRVNLPGADLSALDFESADLRGANLTNSDLSDAILTRADLTGAEMDGATLAGASLEGAILAGVDLTGIDLSGVQLGGIVGPARLTQVGGTPDAEAADQLPNLLFSASVTDLSRGEPGVPDFAVSRRHAMVLLRPGTSLEDFNSLLGTYGAALVGSRPSDATLPRGLAMLEFPTTSAMALFELLEQVRAEAAVDAAAPDVMMSHDTVSNDEGSGSSITDLGTLINWIWEEPPRVGNGNWGLKEARVPQMWNLNKALEKIGPATVSTLIVDSGFEAHEDLILTDIGPASVAGPSHGMHVAGIVGATFGNQLGIDGANPFAQLTGYSTQPGLRDFLAAGIDVLVPYPVPAKAYRFCQDAANALAANPGARLLNSSQGFNWSGFDLPFNSLFASLMQSTVSEYGKVFAALASANPNVLFVVASGNDSGQISAPWNSPMANAALAQGAGNILVIGSHDPGGNPSGFSNPGGHLDAPGYAILSLTPGNGYRVASGTSQATPLVTGVAGYLLAIDPSLDAPTLVSLLTSFGSRLDAFASLLEIDNLGTSQVEILRLLLDLDDGSPDGNVRLEPRPAELSRDRSFEYVETGADNRLEDIDGDGGPGNGLVDMGDFRRWRDWLLYGEGNGEEGGSSLPNRLNGPADHPKHDANRDGETRPGKETSVYPRADFNGDGKMDRLSAEPMFGLLHGQTLTDLQVLTESGYWEDEYVEAPDLVGLVNSVDLHVSAENAFALNDEVTHAEVWVVETDTDTRWGAPRPFSAGEREFIYTVPTEKRFHLATDPIPFGDESAIILRSIGERVFLDQEVGGDFAVDLVAVEMTARAQLLETGLKDTQAKPDEEEVDAHIPAIGGFAEAWETAGAAAWANDEASFFCVVRTGIVPDAPNEVRQPRTFRSELTWRRTFLKAEGEPDPRFKVKPMKLKLIDGLSMARQDLDFRALAELKLEKRIPGTADWDTVFHTRAKITGASEGIGGGHTFRLDHEGDIPQGDFEVEGGVFETRDPETGEVIGSFAVTNIAHYIQSDWEADVPLDDVPEGGSFELRYTLLAEGLDYGPDSYAEAFIADPLDYATAVQMAYGRFGELPLILEVDTSGGNNAEVSFRSRDGFYYSLADASPNGSAGNIIAMALGQPEQMTLLDPAPPPGANADAYVVLMRRIEQPRDADADGIDDVYELLRAHFLNPLDPSDASLDQDGDGFTNKSEYENGTDPEVPDAPVGGDLPFYPGMVVPVGLEGALETADLNQDARPDFVGLGGTTGPALAAALANPDASYQLPVLTPINDPVGLGFAVGRLDDDAWPDVVLTGVDRQLLVYRGLGNGRFEWVANVDSGDSLTRIVLGDFNGDGLPDVLGVAESARRILLFPGSGDGLLGEPLPLQFIFVPQDVVVGHFNADPWVDLAVCLINAQVAVLYGSENAGFGEPQFHPVGFSPRRVAAGDINQDGRDDIVTANQNSDDISVLLSLPAGGFAAELRFATGDNPSGLALADLDEDTWLDLLVSHRDSDHHSLLFNDGAGGLLEPRSIYSSSDNGNCLVGDYDGDGITDLAAALFQERVLILKGDGDGGFPTRGQINIPRALPQEVQLFDLDGAAPDELLVLDQRSHELQVWAFESAPGPIHPPPSARLAQVLPAPASVESFVVADFNHDTRPDLAVLSAEPEFFGSGENVVTLFLAQPDGSFAEGISFNPGMPGRKLVSARLNADAFPDLIVVVPQDDFSTPENEVRLMPFLNDGQGGFTPSTPLQPGEFLYTALASDLDGDGKDEILISGFAGGQNFVARYAWDGDSNWLPPQTLPTGGGALLQWSWASLASGEPASLLAAVQAQGFTPARVVAFDVVDGALTGPRTILPDVSTQGVAAGDVNGDGLPDLVTGGGLLHIHLADGFGGWSEPEEYWVGNGRDTVIISDVNGDAAPDLIGWGAFAPGISLLGHTGLP